MKGTIDHHRRIIKNWSVQPRMYKSCIGRKILIFRKSSSGRTFYANEIIFLTTSRTIIEYRQFDNPPDEYKNLIGYTNDTSSRTICPTNLWRFMPDAFFRARWLNLLPGMKMFLTTLDVSFKLLVKWCYFSINMSSCTIFWRFFLSV